MKTLEELSSSIDSKRREDLDGSIDVELIKLSAYDIRVERDIESMAETLKRDGQLEFITVNFDEEFYVIVNGRTRYLALKQPILSLKKLKCKVYKGLTILEQNYLNATINTNQKTLTTDEKLRFVIRHENDLDSDSLRKALGLKSKTQLKAFLNVANMDKEAREIVKTTKLGRERGTFEIETLNIISRAKEPEVQRIFARHSKQLLDRDITDRTRRTEIRQKVNTYNKLKDKKEELKLNETEIARIVVSRSLTTLNSLLKIAKGSEGKYKAFWTILKDGKFEEIIIFNPTTPYLIGSPNNKSEALMTLELSRLQSMNLIFVDRDKAICDIWKRKENFKVINKSAEEYIYHDYESSHKKTLIYLNLAGDRTAREFLSPKLLLTLKNFRPNLTIAFIVVEEWSNPTNKASNCLELLRFFGIDRDDEITTIESFLDKIEELIDFKMSFSIVWEKRENRRVALVVLK